QARRHRHQPDGGRSWRRHGHGDVLHLPRVSRPVECGLRDTAGDGVPCDHHHRHDPADETCRTAREAAHMSEAIFRDTEADRAFRARRFTGKFLIYALLILWAIICLFPIYWTITTSFKTAPNVMQGALIPWIDYVPAWLGWRSLGLSPETIL